MYWPHQQGGADDDIATVFDRVPEHVASGGTPDLSWAGLLHLGPDLPVAVREVRNRHEHVALVGRLELVQALLREGCETGWTCAGWTCGTGARTAPPGTGGMAAPDRGVRRDDRDPDSSLSGGTGCGASRWSPGYRRTTAQPNSSMPARSRTGPMSVASSRVPASSRGWVATMTRSSSSSSAVAPAAAMMPSTRSR